MQTQICRMPCTRCSMRRQVKKTVSFFIASVNLSKLSCSLNFCGSPSPGDFGHDQLNPIPPPIFQSPHGAKGALDQFQKWGRAQHFSGKLITHPQTLSRLNPLCNVKFRISREGTPPPSTSMPLPVRPGVCGVTLLWSSGGTVNQKHWFAHYFQ